MKQFIVACIIGIALASPANAGYSSWHRYTNRLIDQWSESMVDCRNPELSDENRDKACKKTASLGEKLDKAGCFIERSTSWTCQFGE